MVPACQHDAGSAGGTAAGGLPAGTGAGTGHQGRLAGKRGEVRSGALTPECTQTGPALLRQHFTESGQQPSDKDIRLLVDNVLIPMLRPVP
jgi:hypothetical protein